MLSLSANGERVSFVAPAQPVSVGVRTHISIHNTPFPLQIMLLHSPRHSTQPIRSAESLGAGGRGTTSATDLDWARRYVRATAYHHVPPAEGSSSFPGKYYELEYQLKQGKDSGTNTTQQWPPRVSPRICRRHTILEITKDGS